MTLAASHPEINPSGPASPLVDKFGRVHDYLRLSLTERCNLRCFYCMPEDGIRLHEKEAIMRQDEIIDMANVFSGLGVKKIRLTGGEPLVRKDAPEIISRLGELPGTLGITTNGILVDRFIDTFKNAGINSVNVSLDSLNREKQAKISRRDYFERIIGNINLLLEEGFEVKVNTVLMKDVNDDEILNFIDWTKDLPLHVRFIEFMPFSGNKWSWDRGVSHDTILQTVRDHYTDDGVIKIDDHPNDTTKNFKVDGFAGTFGVIASMTNPFCGTCNRIRLTADGKMKNCLFSRSETDLLTPFREGSDIVPLIRSSIWDKKAQRAGHDSIENMEGPNARISERTMVSIGG